MSKPKRAKRKPVDPSRRRSHKLICRDKWREFQDNSFKQKKTLLDEQGNPVRKMRVDAEGNESPTNEIAKIHLFWLTPEIEGGDFYMTWYLGKRKFEIPASNFVAFLPEEEQSSAWDRLGVLGIRKPRRP